MTLKEFQRLIEEAIISRWSEEFPWMQFGKSSKDWTSAPWGNMLKVNSRYGVFQNTFQECDEEMVKTHVDILVCAMLRQFARRGPIEFYKTSKTFEVSVLGLPVEASILSDGTYSFTTYGEDTLVPREYEDALHEAANMHKDVAPLLLKANEVSRWGIL